MYTAYRNSTKEQNIKNQEKISIGWWCHNERELRNGSHVNVCTPNKVITNMLSLQFQRERVTRYINICTVQLFLIIGFINFMDLAHFFFLPCTIKRCYHAPIMKQGKRCYNALTMKQGKNPRQPGQSHCIQWGGMPKPPRPEVRDHSSHFFVTPNTCSSQLISSLMPHNPRVEYLTKKFDSDGISILRVEYC